MKSTKKQLKTGGDPNCLLNQKWYRNAQKKLIKNGNNLTHFLTDQVKK